jgi:hypothetical protein
MARFGGNVATADMSAERKRLRINALFATTLKPTSSQRKRTIKKIRDEKISRLFFVAFGLLRLNFRIFNS